MLEKKQAAEEGCLLRTATADDAADIQRIYAHYVEQTAISFEVVAPTVEEMRRRISLTLRKYPYWVAIVDGQLAGYAYAGPLGERLAYRWSVETTVYVEVSQRRRGLGRMLYAALEEQLRRQGFRNAYACIAVPAGAEVPVASPENTLANLERAGGKADAHLTLNSVRFHARMGYATVAHFHRCGWKFSSWYDVVWMEKILLPHDEATPAEPSAPEVYSHAL